MSSLLTGTTLFASFVGGMVALFAPCCISVMLPSYFATTFGRRLRLVAMTFVFATGIGTVILPIALGAAGVGTLVRSHHFAFFLAGGLMMLALGLFTLAGRKLPIPMIGMRASTSQGPLAVYSLGLFSGVASSCCAPVLAGVVALSGLSGSFPAALAIGATYVFGMVFPLFLLALVWDRLNLGESRLVRGRTFERRFRGRAVRLHSTALVSGLLLAVMGVVAIVLAFRGASMRTSGWQTTFSAYLQHKAHVLTTWVAALPGVVSVGVLVASFLTLAWIGINQASTGDDDEALAHQSPTRHSSEPPTLPPTNSNSELPMTTPRERNAV
jgi:cytochrome c-type biogenesis protein